MSDGAIDCWFTVYGRNFQGNKRAGRQRGTESCSVCLLKWPSGILWNGPFLLGSFQPCTPSTWQTVSLWSRLSHLCLSAAHCWPLAPASRLSTVAYFLSTPPFHPLSFSFNSDSCLRKMSLWVCGTWRGHFTLTGIIIRPKQLSRCGVRWC